MSDQPSLFDRLTEIVNPIRLARSNDPDTSHQAAENASLRGPSQRVRVYRYLQANGGSTDYEISVGLGLLRSSVAKRRQELADINLVTDSGYRRVTDTGTSAIVWRLSYTDQSEVAELSDDALARHFATGLKMLTDALAVKPTTGLVSDLRADGYDEAANEIERLRAEVAELRAANGF